MTIDVLIPGLSLRSNPGLKLANAFGVIGRPKDVLPDLGAGVDSILLVSSLQRTGTHVLENLSQTFLLH